MIADVSMPPRILERFVKGRRSGLCKYSFLCVILIFLSFPLSWKTTRERLSFAPFKHPSSFLKNESRYERFCLQLNRSIALEQPFSFTLELNSSNDTIPYFYSRWQSTAIMPRLMSPCDHAIHMRLLSLLINHVFQKHNIQYMMMAATLLGM